MRSFERKEKILKKLRSVGKITIEDAQMIGVSVATIYRDLVELENQGLVKRIRGGAIFRQALQGETHFDIRMRIMVKEKEEIAKKAQKLIYDDTSIFLDHSSTAMFLARELKTRHFRNLTLLTNSLAIPYDLSSQKGIQVVLTGGVVESEFEALTGHLVIARLKSINLHQIFASVGAITLQDGLMTQIPFIYELLPAIFQLGREVNILVDHSKFFKIATYRIAPLDSSLNIITDRGLPQNLLGEMQKQGVRVII